MSPPSATGTTTTSTLPDRGSKKHIYVNRVETGSVNLPVGSFPTDCDSVTVSSSEASKITQEWLDSFNTCIEKGDFDSLVAALFVSDEPYWRDHLVLSWDFHTLHKSSKIAAFLNQDQRGKQLTKLSLDATNPNEPRLAPHEGVIDDVGEIEGVEAFLAVETQTGRGRGMLRLVKQKGEWKCFTLFTTLTELKGFEEPVGSRRANGVQHGADPKRRNWAEKRQAEIEWQDEEPSVIVMGAGQAGLMIAARLKMLGVKALIVDQNERIGDNWRNRYHQLVLHDPIWYDHMPYIPFPSHWPIFTPKDKLAEFFDCYAKLLELNVWMSSSITSSTYSSTTHKWDVSISRTQPDGTSSTRTFHPKHVIMATGHSGKPNFPSHIPNISNNTFRGTLCHSSGFTGATPQSSDGNGKRRRAIVVGCCNSGHDIAMDFVEKGYHVTMIQRSTTCVISSTQIVEGLKPTYCEGSLPADDGDLLLHGHPCAILKKKHINATAKQAVADKTILDGLDKAGFAQDRGPDDAGLFIKYFTRGGGYYIDVGASALIADGKIKIKQGCEITSVQAQGLQFDDGEVLEADEIVFATGYLNMRTQASMIFGEEVGEKVKDVWGFDEEGEIRTMWRGSGMEGFWYMGGNLALCRYYSRLLALQIKAVEEGIMHA